MIINKKKTEDDDFFDIEEEYISPSNTFKQKKQLGRVHIDEHIFEEDDKPLTLDNITLCPKCKHTLQHALSMSGSESTFWLECPDCGALVNTFKPLAHQQDFLTRSERYKMMAGGYGTGKTTTDVEDVIKHLMIIPHARVCIAARTYPALESTFIKEFQATFPNKLISKRNDQKHEYRLTNGSEIIFRSFDDPTKLKSLNLTKVVIVEASDVPYEGFEMMQTRLRNTSALIPYYNADGTPVTYYDEQSREYKISYRVDARTINLETNPASNWVKSKFLCDSYTIKYLGSAKDEHYNISKDPDKNKYTQIVSTDANPYLPETYIPELCKGKSDAWIQQFIYGSFNFNDSLVFPNIGLCIVSPHKFPREFDEYGRRRLFYLIGLDYGIVDYTHVIYAALSLDTHKLYVYDELRINNSDVRTIAREYRKNTRINGTHLDGLLMLPLFDGRSYNKRESDLKTIGGAFEAVGLYFQPSFSGHEERMVKVNSLVNHNQLEIYSNCEYVIEELLNYEFQKDRMGKSTGKPQDGNDHGITALEFIIVELPHNLQSVSIQAYNPEGKAIVHDKQIVIDTPTKKEKVYNPLEKEEDTYGNFGNNYLGVSNTYFGIDYSDNAGGIQEDDEIIKPCEAYIPNR